jgi:hypothetical protein
MNMSLNATKKWFERRVSFKAAIQQEAQKKEQMEAKVRKIFK